MHREGIQIMQQPINSRKAPVQKQRRRRESNQGPGRTRPGLYPFKRVPHRHTFCSGGGAALRASCLSTFACVYMPLGMSCFSFRCLSMSKFNWLERKTVNLEVGSSSLPRSTLAHQMFRSRHHHIKVVRKVSFIHMRKICTSI